MHFPMISDVAYLSYELLALQLSLLFVHNMPVLFFLVNFENLCVWLQVLYQICKLQKFSSSLKYFQSLNTNFFFFHFVNLNM